MSENQIIDLGVVAVYLLGIAIYGVWVGRRETATSEAYYLGGRKFGWFAIGASIFATNISITQFMSAGGLAHQVGLASINNDLIGGALLAVSSVFFVPVYIRSRLFTMPEFLERRYSRTTRQIFGWIYLMQSVLQQPTGYYLGGLALLGLFGLSFEYLPLACLVIGLTVGVYSVVGGLTAVVKTDVVQVVLLVGGGIAVSLLGVSRAGGWTALREQFGPTHFELLLPRGSDMPWTALPGIALHSSYFAFCSIPILQRVLGARNEYHAKCGMLFGGWLKLLAIPLFALPGIVALKLFPDSVGDATYAMLVRELLPVGISGLVLAGMLAALMSSADSNVNAMSSVVAVDIYPQLVKNSSDQRALRFGKWTAAIIVVFGVSVAPYYQHLGAIYLFILRLGGFLFLPVGVCFIFGRFSRRVNSIGAIACLVVGGSIGLAYVFLTSLPPLKPYVPNWIVTLHFYEMLPFFFVACIVSLFSVSCLGSPPSRESLQVLDQIKTHAEGKDRHVWQRFETWIALFCGSLGLIYVVF